MKIILLFTVSLYAQPLTKISLKVAPSFCGQVKSPPLLTDGDMSNGYAVTIEPAIFTFGSKSQFDLGADISYIRKSNQNTSNAFLFDPFGKIIAQGSETYRVNTDYFSFSPNLRWNFGKIFFIKTGPRVDALISFETLDSFDSDPRTREDFEPLTYGFTYGAGLTAGKHNTKFIFEFVGQHDFTTSSFNSSTGQTYTNYCFLINLGLTLDLQTSAKD